jgi:hypothetical protein
MALSDLEMVKEAIRTIARFRASHDPAIADLFPLMYTPDSRIAEALVRLNNLSSSKKLSDRQAAGYVMEEVAFLAFRSLQGWSSLKGYQSAGPQHDLLIEGVDADWAMICRQFYMPEAKQAIVIEAKATGTRLSDAQFARMCAIMDYNLVHAGLGIFVTLEGATGFPTGTRSALRSVSDCRLRQVIYYAGTKKPIIVFDKSDLRQLTTNGSLPLLIHRKVKEIFELTGVSTLPVTDFQEEVMLPPHLAKLV